MINQMRMNEGEAYIFLEADRIVGRLSIFMGRLLVKREGVL